jgi:paraquat-inducible protein A
MTGRSRVASLRKETVSEKSRPHLFAGKTILILIALLYAGGAILAAWNVITHTQASTKAIEQILTTYNMKNEGEQSLDRFSKEHPILGTLFGSPLRHELGLPSQQQSAQALHSDVSHLLKSVREESSSAAWWSWFLLCLSFFYAVTMIALDRSFTARSVIFALTTISVTFFIIGILAPAMIIWTAPTIPMESGQLNFVLQHEVRGIAAIIWELFTGGHWVIGGFLFLFSIVTPLTKASLTYFVTASPFRDLNFKIGEILHAIGKWSMADVFVAAILLALYALKFQEATKSIPCLGLYYFIGYCLLSMTTTELLTHSAAVAGNDEKKSKGKVGLKVVAGLFVGLFCFVSASSLYTYQQYTENIKETVKAPSSPQQLNNAHLVLPAHQ